MAKELIMPKFGFTQETAEVVEWLVEEGAEVEAGDPLLEVTTDKVNMEVEAPIDGILAGVKVQVGDVVPVTEVIGYILQPGESLPEEPAETTAQSVPFGRVKPSIKPQKEAAAAGGTATPVAARMAADLGVNLAEVSGSGSGGRITREDVESYVTRRRERDVNVIASAADGRIRATPAARRVAREEGVDISGLTGTGPRGRIQEADVLAAEQGGFLEAVSEPTPISQDGVPRHTVVPMTRMRQVIGRNLQGSWQAIPHITFTTAVDMTAVEKLLQDANRRVEEPNEKVTVTAVIARAAAWALRRHPIINRWYVDGEIWQMDEVNIGLAVALEDGLIVPVISEADKQGVLAISRNIRELARRARQGQLKPANLEGATFTISNLGMFGVDHFTAIINPPQVGILAVGRTRSTFVPDKNGQPEARLLCSMTLAVDHRVVDGAVAARFIEDLTLAVEAPETMIL